MVVVDEVSFEEEIEAAEDVSSFVEDVVSVVLVVFEEIKSASSEGASSSKKVLVLRRSVLKSFRARRQSPVNFRPPSPSAD